MIAALQFDATISLGTVLQTIMLAGVLIGVYIRLKTDVTELKAKVEIMYDFFQSEMERRHGK